MTITLNDLKANAKFRGTMFLDMDHGAYESHYQSQTYPRLSVIKAGAPHSRKVKQIHTTTYFVDSMECPDLDAVLTMLNAVHRSPQDSKVRAQEFVGDPQVPVTPRFLCRRCGFEDGACICSPGFESEADRG